MQQNAVNTIRNNSIEAHDKGDDPKNQEEADFTAYNGFIVLDDEAIGGFPELDKLLDVKGP